MWYFIIWLGVGMVLFNLCSALGFWSSTERTPGEYLTMGQRALLIAVWPALLLALWFHFLIYLSKRK